MADEQPTQLAPAVRKPGRAARKYSALLAVTAGLAGAMGALCSMVFLAQRGPRVVVVRHEVPLSTPTPVPVVTPLEEPRLGPELPPTQSARPSLEGTWVLADEARTLLVLETGLDVPEQGAKRFGEPDGFTYSMDKQVPAHVRASYADFAGTTVALYGEKGVVCQAQVGHVFYHKKAYTEWEPESVERAWGEFGETLLVASLTPVRGDCKEGRWARDAALTPSVTAVLSDAEGRERKEVLKAFAKLSVVEKIQREFEQETGRKTPWYLDEELGLTVTRIVGEHDTLMAVSVASPGCGYFYGEAAGIFRHNGREYELVFEHDEAMCVVGAADINGDGHTDLFSRFDTQMILTSTGAGFEKTAAFTIQSFICPC